jgi:hypothetical protein
MKIFEALEIGNGMAQMHSRRGFAFIDKQTKYIRFCDIKNTKEGEITFDRELTVEEFKSEGWIPFSTGKCKACMEAEALDYDSAFLIRVHLKKYHCTCDNHYREN